MAYKRYFSFEVLEALKDKKELYVLDKLNVDVKNLMEMCVEELMWVVRAAETDTDRFLFWEIVNGDENEQE
jgi:hypothetical protein